LVVISFSPQQLEILKATEENLLLSSLGL